MTPALENPMIKPLSSRAAAWCVVLATVLPLSAQAHRPWLLPSATVLSGHEPWVAVDAAGSTDLFYADHHPMRLDGLVVTAPDGHRAAPEHLGTGKYRSTFDLKLAQPGTYRLAVVNDGMNVAYQLNGENKRWRGTAEALATALPAGAQNLRVTHSQSRSETFVTAGKPNTQALAPAGTGLELVPLTHPNDLVSGSAATFGLLLDGRPAAGVTVTVIPGGIRYRDRLGDMRVTTGQDGRFSVTWPAPGMYWLSASQGGGRDAPAGSIGAPARRVSYTATLEVLPQ
jgi:uncharacterized GH25 family protein